MKTIALTCNNCGAGLELDEQIRFVTCRHCGARLEVQQSADAVYTKVLEQVQAVTSKVEEIEIDRELEKIEHSLSNLLHPGGWASIGFFSLLPAAGLLMFLVADSNEVRGSGMALLLFMGPLVLWLAWGLQGRIDEYTKELSELLARRSACNEKLHRLLTRR